MEHIDYSQENKIKELLLGHTVVKVEDDMLRLDDGRFLRIVPNSGCGGCSSGWYELTELNDCPINAIMSVELVDEPYSEYEDEDPDEYEDHKYSIFVLAQDNRIKLAEIDGSDGNGYYGSGYRILVYGFTENKSRHY